MASTMSNSANTVLVLWHYESGRQASRHVGVASHSALRCHFVLAKVHWGLISVHCSELRGVRFSGVCIVFR